MNIEVKRSIELDSVLQVLKEKSETNKVGKMGKEVVIEKDVLKDAVSVIEVLVKKNKQLRDINKNLSDKIVKKNESIVELTRMCKKLNDQVFELESKVEENKCCCKGESEKQKPEEEYDLQDVLNELEVINELVAVARLIGIL